MNEYNDFVPDEIIGVKLNKENIFLNSIVYKQSHVQINTKKTLTIAHKRAAN